MYLCHTIGPDYLCGDNVRGVDERKPVLAQSAGAAIAYSYEDPNMQMYPETLKPLICMMGRARKREIRRR